MDQRQTIGRNGGYDYTLQFRPVVSLQCTSTLVSMGKSLFAVYFLSRHPAIPLPLSIRVCMEARYFCFDVEAPYAASFNEVFASTEFEVHCEF